MGGARDGFDDPRSHMQGAAEFVESQGGALAYLEKHGQEDLIRIINHTLLCKKCAQALIDILAHVDEGTIE